MLGDSIESDVPQGSVLDPLLLCLYVFDIFKCLKYLWLLLNILHVTCSATQLFEREVRCEIYQLQINAALKRLKFDRKENILP